MLDPPLPHDPTQPDAAKFERGAWSYRMTFPARRGSGPRYIWYPPHRFTETQEPLLSRLRASAEHTVAAVESPSPWRAAFDLPLPSLESSPPTRYRFGVAAAVANPTPSPPPPSALPPPPPFLTSRRSVLLAFCRPLPGRCWEIATAELPPILACRPNEPPRVAASRCASTLALDETSRLALEMAVQSSPGLSFTQSHVTTHVWPIALPRSAVVPAFLAATDRPLVWRALDELYVDLYASQRAPLADALRVASRRLIPSS